MSLSYSFIRSQHSDLKLWIKVLGTIKCIVQSAVSVRRIQSTHGNRVGLGRIFYHTLAGVLRAETIRPIISQLWHTEKSRGTSPGGKIQNSTWPAINRRYLFFHISGHIESLQVTWYSVSYDVQFFTNHDPLNNHMCKTYHCHTIKKVKTKMLSNVSQVLFFLFTVYNYQSCN